MDSIQRKHRSSYKPFIQPIKVHNDPMLNVDGAKHEMEAMSVLFAVPNRNGQEEPIDLSVGILPYYENPMYPNPHNQYQQQQPMSRAEVLKSAKNMFSKRTKVLWHWMNPNVPKKNVNDVINTHWNSLPANEKEYWISQALGRLGEGDNNPAMVNPQISSMPGSLLQNEQELDENSYPEEKRKRGRPRINKQKQRMNFDESNAGNAFKDDPELSIELEKFTTTYYKGND